MAQIQKLQLQGIRSFGPEEGDRQNVEFFSPLTLILGQNGCGKTTIIECLKYVTTGDPPPGSRAGQSFVHDPKMARETTVRGQVKLMFRDVGGTTKIVARTIEASQKLKNITIKTLDGTISTKREGRPPTSISSKCADINADMFISLGVSKPILNYVIFCHQEDSNWPLEEGSKVKDKFDEIFNSAKYKLCLKNIKDVRKKEVEQAKLDKNSMDHYRSDKELSDEKTREAKKRKVDIEKLHDTVAELQEEMEPIIQQLKEIQAKETNFSGIQEMLTKAQTNFEHSKKERVHLEEILEEVFPETETDAEIEQRKNGVGEATRRQEREMDDKKKKIDEYKMQEAKLDKDLQKNAAKIGESVAKKNKHRQDCQQRGEIAENALKDFDVENDGSDTVVLLGREEARIKKDAKRVKAEAQQKEERMGEMIDELKSKLTGFQGGKKREQQEIMGNNREIAKITRQLRELEGAADKLSEVKDKWTRGQQDLDREKKKIDAKKLQEEVETEREEVRDLEVKEGRLKEELRVLEEQQSVLQKVEFISKDIQVKEQKLKKIMTKRNSEFIDLFGIVPDTKRLKDKYREALTNAEENQRNLDNEKKKRDSEVSAKKSSRSDWKKETEKKTQRMHSLEQKVGDVIQEGEDIDEELEKVKEELEKSRRELQVKEAGKWTYADMLEVMSKMAAPACPTCSREFGKKHEADELREELQEKIDAIPGKVRALENRVKQKTSQMERLQQVRPDVAALVQVKKEVEEGRAKIATLEKDIKKLDIDLEEEMIQINETQADMLKLKGVGDDVQMIDVLARELRNLEDDRQEINAKTPDVVEGRELVNVRREEQEICEKLKKIRRRNEDKMENLNRHRTLVNSLETQQNQLTQRKLEIEGQQQERANTIQKKEELEMKVRKSQEEVVRCDEEIGPLQEELKDKEQEKMKIKGEGVRMLEKIEEKARKIERILGDLDRLDTAIAEFMDSGMDYLEKQKEEKRQLENKQENLRRMKGEEEKQVAMLNEAIVGQAARKRLCEDNLKLRRYKREEKEAEMQAKEAERVLEQEDYQEVRRKKNKLQKKYNELNDGINKKSGKLQEMESSLKDTERELRNPKLRDAAQKFRETSTKYEIRKLATEDLNKYYIALDYAIMGYHKEKMKVVNRFIRELWRTVYRGNDIDYIEIKTDDADVSAGADKKKNYNYRVVMVKNETEMDMRGRCSAGQKVLASLIIRLALAETFSTNCGIIALDEPTTNLDRENIESLAVALADIANKRVGQRNFQLVVITHDEEFIELLSRADQITHYQKVSRNARGLSEIRKLATSDIVD